MTNDCIGEEVEKLVSGLPEGGVASRECEILQGGREE